MDADEVKKIILEGLADCEITVTGDGSHFDVVAVGDIFENKSMVAKQQLIYATVNEQITSGAIHAINIKTYTPTEWEKASKLQVF